MTYEAVISTPQSVADSTSAAALPQALLAAAARWSSLERASVHTLLERVRLESAQHTDPAVRRALKQALEASLILGELHLDADSVSACLAADLPELVDDMERLRSAVGKDAATLALGLRRARQIDLLAAEHAPDKAQSARLESLRKMVLAMAQDVRVVLIQLAEHLVVMRSLTKAPPAQREAAGRATMDLYAPLANRLGVWQIKWELEDLAFRFLEPAVYQGIAAKLDERRVDREGYIERMMRELRVELGEHGVRAEVSGRPKHLYSIYKKMQRKHLEFEDLYDVRAVRVLVREVKDCYAALGVVHSLWQPIPGEFDDYISHPKGNNYRSLHTAVMGPQNKTVEVQIRTHEMHQESELGVAAHWRYKEGGHGDAKYNEKIAWLRQILDWKDEVAQSRRLDANTRLFEDTIYVLTPQGQIIDLPQGATPIDFAYHLHTDLGHHCRGAKVDGGIVPLNYRLRNAQRVEITAAKQGGPSRDWLNPELGYLASPRALAKVRAWFKQQQLAEAVDSGRATLEKEMQRAGKSGLAIDKLAQAMHFSKAEDLFAAIGHGELSSRQIQLAIAELAAPAVAASLPERAEPTGASKAVSSTSGVLVLGVDNLATSVAKCCKPVPPEPIIGFVTKSRGVMVHRADCENVRAMDVERGRRLMPAQWGSRIEGPFSVDLAIEAIDRAGLLRDISDVMAREHVNVTAVNTQSRGGSARMHFTVELADLAKLQQMLIGLRAVPSVLAASRKRGA